MDLMIAVQSILKISGEFAGEKDAAVFGGFRENQEVVRKLTKSLKFINGRYRRKYSADFMEVSVIVASHDVELIDLLDSDHYANYYFCEKAKNVL